jgi:hypothetical protein
MAYRQWWHLLAIQTQFAAIPDIHAARSYSQVGNLIKLLELTCDSWDSKWIYLEQKYTVGDDLYAIGFAKLVVKDKKNEDILPGDVLKLLGVTEYPKSSSKEFSNYLRSLEGTFR